ncbi:MAG: hypothetical protein ACYS47_00985 [Planctomycetota bacterium]|jgi:hypothetical protein
MADPPESPGALPMGIGLLVVAGTVAGNLFTAYCRHAHPGSSSLVLRFFLPNLLTFFGLSVGFYLLGGAWGERFRLITAGVLSMALALSLIFIDHLIVYQLVANAATR